MKHNNFLVFAALCAITSVFSQTYITNVTVADVEKHQMLPGKTVVIDGDIITDIKSGKVAIPVGATVIDGSGKFLMPGMTDAHIHFFQSGGLYARPDAIDLRELKPYQKEIAEVHQRMENVLRRYLKNGITTVVDVGATNNFLKQRQDFAEKDFVPKVYMTGPLLTTYLPKAYAGLKDDSPFHLVKTPEEGRNMVRDELQYKPDFIKIWYIAHADGMTPEAAAHHHLPVIKAIIDEAHQHNLKVAVHATERITAQLAVENGCDFLVHSIDDEVISDEFVGLIKKNKLVLCPTLVVHSGYMDTFGQRLAVNSHELKQADPFVLGSLLDLKHIRIADTTLVKNYLNYARDEKEIARMKQESDNCYKNLKKLSDAGCIVAAGTDAGNIGTLHASSYLDELLAMQQAGMSRWQVIEAATVNGAKMLGKAHEFGAIAKGKKADLLLLDANPIADLENLTKIYRIINKGVVFEPEKVLTETPEELVQRQLNAYNFRNIEGFLDTYADDVEVYTFPDKLDYKGKDTMRKIYADMFARTPNLHCEIKGRIVQGNIVIDSEHVIFGSGSIDGTAIYHVESGKIKKVYFLP